MTLTKEDLTAIENLITQQLQPLKDDIKVIKEDLRVLARLNQLDKIRRDATLRILYADEKQG